MLRTSDAGEPVRRSVGEPVSLAENSEATAVSVARIEERARALEDRMSRTEDSIERAVQLARGELERRLDILNHAHEQSVADRAQFVSRTEIRWLVGLVVAIAIALIGLAMRGR